MAQLSNLDFKQRMTQQANISIALLHHAAAQQVIVSIFFPTARGAGSEEVMPARSTRLSFTNKLQGKMVFVEQTSDAHVKTEA